MNVKECLKDLYQLGIIQGEHNINWKDENNLLESSKKYYSKTRIIADKYGIEYTDCIEDYRENDGEEEYWLWDKTAFHLNEIVKEYIQNIIQENI